MFSLPGHLVWVEHCVFILYLYKVNNSARENMLLAIRCTIFYDKMQSRNVKKSFFCNLPIFNENHCNWKVTMNIFLLRIFLSFLYPTRLDYMNKEHELFTLRVHLGSRSVLFTSLIYCPFTDMSSCGRSGETHYGILWVTLCHEYIMIW